MCTYRIWDIMLTHTLSTIGYSVAPLENPYIILSSYMSWGWRSWNPRSIQKELLLSLVVLGGYSKDARCSCHVRLTSKYNTTTALMRIQIGQNTLLAMQGKCHFQRLYFNPLQKKNQGRRDMIHQVTTTFKVIYNWEQCL